MAFKINKDEIIAEAKRRRQNAEKDYAAKADVIAGGYKTGKTKTSAGTTSEKEANTTASKTKALAKLDEIRNTLGIKKSAGATTAEEVLAANNPAFMYLQKAGDTSGIKKGSDAIKYGNAVGENDAWWRKTAKAIDEGSTEADTAFGTALGDKTLLETLNKLAEKNAQTKRENTAAADALKSSQKAQGSGTTFGKNQAKTTNNMTMWERLNADAANAADTMFGTYSPGNATGRSRIGNTVASGLQDIGSSWNELLGYVTNQKDSGLTEADKAFGYVHADGTVAKPVETPETIKKTLQGVSDRAYKRSDKMAQEAEESKTMAKDGLGIVGSTAVDAGSVAVQMAADAALAPLTGGSSLGAMAVRSFGGGLREARADGADAQQQFGYGLLSATTEVLTEKIGSIALPFKSVYGAGAIDDIVEQLVKNSAKTPLGQAALKALLSMVAEGSEEVISDLVNPIIKKATYDKGALKEYGTVDYWSNLLYDGVIGGLLGGLGAGGNVVGAINQNKAAAKTYGADPQAIVSSGLETAEGTTANTLAQKAQQKLDNGQKISGSEYYKLANAIDEAYNTEKKTNDASAVSSRLAQLGTDASERTVNAIVKAANGETLSRAEQKAFNANPYSQRVVNEMTDTRGVTGNEWYTNAEQKGANAEQNALSENLSKRFGISQSEVERVYAMNKSASPQAFETAFSAMYQMGRNGASRAMIGNISALSQEQADTAYQMGAASRYFKNKGANNNEIYLRNVAERTGSQNTGGQVRGVAESTGSNVTGAGGSGQSSYSAVQGKAGEQVVYNGVAQKNVYYYTGEETEDMKKGRELIESYGYKVAYFVGGNIRVPGGSVRGVVDTENKTVMVRADHPDLTALQIARHEMGHAAIAKGDFTLAELRQRLLKDFTDAEIDEMVEVYRNAYSGILSVDEAFEEICCDALGKINIFAGTKQNSANYAKAQRSIRNYATDRNSSEGRAPPKKGGVKHSIETLPDGNAVYNIGAMEERSFPTAQKALNGSSANSGALGRKASSEPSVTDNGKDVKKNTAKTAEKFSRETEKNSIISLNNDYTGNISPESGSVRFSLEQADNIEARSVEYLKNPKNEVTHITAEELESANKVVNAMVEYMKPYLDRTNAKGGRYLPEEILGDTRFKNGSYGRTIENTTICFRTLAYIDFTNDIKERLGRPLTVEESFLASQMLYDIAKEPQCLYCYVSLDRKAYDEFLLKYIEQRDEVVNKYKALSAKEKTAYAKRKDKSDGGKSPLYKEFLNKRKHTKNMAARFNEWISYAESGAQFITPADLTTEEKRSKIKANGGELAKQIEDAESYAQSASWAKKLEQYRAYNSEILSMSSDMVKALNSEYGLRFYSFSEYTPAFIVENMQQVRDAALKGFKGLAYTKKPDFARIFAPTGMNINISVFGRMDKGEVVPDTLQGADWAEVQELRKQYDNVGAVFVATTDEMVDWALDQDWIDVVIPFHIVRTGANVAEFYNWVNHTGQQADRKINKKGKAGKKADITPPEHNNDYETYKKLVEKRKLIPRFERWYNDERFAGAKYMKLVNETRQPASKTPLLKPNFDESTLEAAKESFNTFVEEGGYYGDWYEDDVDYNKAVESVVNDIKAERKANEVDYGRQTIDFSEAMKNRKKHRQHDQHFSREPETLNELRRQNKVLRERMDYWKRQTKPTKVKQLRMDDIRRLAKEVVSMSETDLKPKDITEGLTELGKYLLNEPELRYTDVSKMAEDIATDVIENATAIVNEEDTAIHDELRDYLKRVKLRDDGSAEFESIRSTYKRRIMFAKKGLGVDTAYAELHDMFGEGYFPEDIINPADQLERIAEVLDNTAPKYVNPNDYYAKEATEFLRNYIIDSMLGEDMRQAAPTYADKAEAKLAAAKAQSAQRLNKQKAEYDEKISSIKAQNEKRIKKAIAEERRRGEKRLQRFRDSVESRDAKRKETAEKNRYKAQIEKNVKTLSDWLLKPDHKNALKHIPGELQSTVRDFIASINFTSARQLGGGAANAKDMRYLSNLERLHRYITDKNVGEDRYSGYLDLPPNFETELGNFIHEVNALARKNSGYTINDMTVEQLKELSDIVKTMKKTITDMNRMYQNRTFRHAYDAGASDVATLKGYVRTKAFTTNLAANRLDQTVMWEQSRPAHVFRRFGKGGESIYREFADAQGTMAFLTKEVLDFANDAYKSGEVKAWAKETHTFEFGDDTVTLTTAQLMSLYELNKRKQAKQHLDAGGFRVANFKNGRFKLETDKKSHAFTDVELGKMFEKLTDRQKEVADKLQRFMVEKGGEWGNYVSIKRFDVEMFKDENYFPIKVDNGQLDAKETESVDNASLYQLLNMGFAKDVSAKANQALVVYDIFDVFANHMSEMAQYRSFALPVLDAMKWFNYKERNESGVVTASFREEMRRAFGSDVNGRGFAEKFITGVIKAYNGAEGRGENTYASKSLNLMNRQAVAYNTRVMIQQPSAIVRAAMFLDPTDLAASLKNYAGITTKANIEEMHKYSGVAVWKDLGFYDVNVSRGVRELIKNDQGAISRINEIGMKGAELADKVTWAALWDASKKKVRRETGLNENSEEFYAKVSELFEDVIYNTQVVDTVLTKSEYSRDKRFSRRLFSSFMSEPMTTASLVTSEIFDIQMKQAAGEKLKLSDYSRLSKTCVVVAVAAAVNSALAALADAWRDDDDYGKFDDKWLRAFRIKLADELMPLTYLPYSSTVWDTFKLMLDKMEKKWFGLDVYGNGTDLPISDIIEATTKVVEIFKEIDEKGESSKYTKFGGYYKVVNVISKLTGVPIYNLMREIVTLNNNLRPDSKWKSYEPSAENSVYYAWKDGYLSNDEALDALQDMGDDSLDADKAYLTLEKWKANASSEYFAVYDAIDNDGDIRSAVKDMLDHGKEEGYVKSAITNHYKDAYINGDNAERARIRKALYATGLYGSVNDVIEKCNSWLK